jgi:hypothetical protein
MFFAFQTQGPILAFSVRDQFQANSARNFSNLEGEAKAKLSKFRRSFFCGTFFLLKSKENVLNCFIIKLLISISF